MGGFDVLPAVRDGPETGVGHLVGRFALRGLGRCGGLRTGLRHARHGPPSVIAHSFGTYLVTRALSDFEGARLHALILFGSIVSETFDWATMVARGQVTWTRMRNEVGAHAAAVRFAAALRRFGYPYGESGVTGFRLDELSRSVNAPYAGPSLADSAL